MQSIKNVEKAEGELKTVNQKYQSVLDKYNKYQKDNKIAIDLFNEQMNILCMLFYCRTKISFGHTMKRNFLQNSHSRTRITFLQNNRVFAFSKLNYSHS